MRVAACSFHPGCVESAYQSKANEYQSAERSMASAKRKQVFRFALQASITDYGFVTSVGYSF